MDSIYHYIKMEESIYGHLCLMYRLFLEKYIR